ncbi:hypothetical protein [Dyella mobilis]|uniref:Uncharacterized protein n=1 Tax=Dyella mobilis TaxID=1849582 RepID=A0ABS2KDZ8_9GAMM|nr:hypothetical protein [Dyella mobilis]MBM7129397.1 hypothetical protein [Dyella mobilis]GLQ98338.1 hypothetical protein GCM10007863_27580 [Dyella mobilis]
MGKVEPLTVEQQLQRLNDWQRAIDDRPKPSSATSRERFVDQWDALESADPSIKANAGYLLRGSTHNNKPPLAQLFEYVEEGFYPPPDLLLTVLDVWNTYRQAAGDVELEEAFFGKPKPKAGSYARREMKKWRDAGAAFQLGELMAEGKTKDQASEIISDKYGVSKESMKKLKPIDPIRPPKSEK